MKVNKCVVILLVFFTFLILFLPVKTYANTVDLTAKGSITITLKEQKEIQDAEITIFKIANAEIKNNKLIYAYDDKISNFNIAIDKLDNIETVKNLSQYILKNNIEGITNKTDNKGQVSFNNLSAGLYLVVETKGITGYYNINPFLISLPSEEEGYNISCIPKVEAVTNPQEKPKDPENSSEQDKKDETPSSNNKIPNTDDKLIQTGQIIWPIIIFSVLGIAFITIGMIVTLSRKKDEA